MKRFNNIDRLVGLILKNTPEQFRSEVKRAIDFATDVHKEDKRFSGEPFIIHSLNIAYTCTQLKLDSTSVIVAILHQVRSSRLKTEEEISHIDNELKQKFNEEIVSLIDSIELLNNATKMNKDTNTEVLKRFMFSSSNDIRPLIIKVCDILDDARTLEYLPEYKKQGFAEKVLNIYSPIAQYLQLGSVKKELDETCFKIINPEAYEVIDNLLKSKNLSDAMIEQYTKYLKTITDILGYKVKIDGRRKSIFSIYRKQIKYANEGKRPDIRSIRDILAFRIITKNIDDCYKVSDAIKQLTIDFPDYFDDYITYPKPNGYRSIQLSVVIPEIADIPVEIQVLTHEMYYYNTYGPAAHVVYKESLRRNTKVATGVDWVKEINDNLKKHSAERTIKFSIPIGGDIFKNRIFVFTPKGLIIELDEESTILDFAYAIHTQIGNRAISAKRNGEKVKLSEKLKTGDIVEVVTQINKKYPEADALSYVVTQQAKSKIRRALRAKLSIAS